MASVATANMQLCSSHIEGTEADNTTTGLTANALSRKSNMYIANE
jgi:hypothetical protein